MLVHFELIVIATVIATCQAYWWSSYPQTNSDENDSQVVRPIPFGYFRSYAYQPMMPYQYYSYYPSYYNSYMSFPQLLTNIPPKKSQNIGKTSETIEENEKSKLSTTTSTSTTTRSATMTPRPPTASISTIPTVTKSPVSQKMQIPADDSIPNSSEEAMERMDETYFDSFQKRIPSWMLRHNDIRAEQQPAVESQLNDAEAKQRIQFVPCMCPISVGAPIPISIGVTEAKDRFTENKIRRFEDLGESDIGEDFTESHL